LKVKTEADNQPPKLLEVNIQNQNSIEIKFDESLDATTATEIHNYQLTNGVAIKSVSLAQDGKTVQLKTGPHQAGEQYTLTIGTLRDRARRPNEIQNYQIDYQFSLKFEDKFDFDNLNSYIWKHVWEEGGIGSHKYDTAGKRLMVKTGDNVGESFSHALPESDRGNFKIDFQPLRNYPTGGRFILKLKQADDSYYQLEKKHGYGVGSIKKVVRGFTVDSTACRYEFQQGQHYRVNINFSPEAMLMIGFNETLKIENNNYPIKVREFEIQLLQQDAYFDNIYFEGR
jgi:hypothetical protein